MSQSSIINCNGKILSLEKPVIMGILNVTQNTFYAPSRSIQKDEILTKAQEMIDAGATILDFGAMSSKPGDEISQSSSEIQSLLPIIKEVKLAFPEIFISIDTLHSEVAYTASKAGVHRINDISGGTYDPSMLSIVSEARLPFILMHMQGLPHNMQKNPSYDDVVLEIIQFFAIQIRKAKNKGIHDIILDPGFGFGKTVEHNYTILKSFEAFQIFEVPLLAGVSRKSMIWRTLYNSPEDALNGATALHMVLLQKGAKILRVHDVKAAKECITLFEKMCLS